MSDQAEAPSSGRTAEGSHGNPLLEALPPKSDYMTYLTILEYNLNREQLPLLHDLLQDERLTTNIGWDLAHLLLPLLPDAEACLLDVARLGNPRETVLKVAELLNGLDGSGEDEASASASSDDDIGDATPLKQAKEHQLPLEAEESRIKAFQCLLHMLCILHPRIKTRHPSRFLATSLPAILRAFASVADSPDAVRAVLMFIHSISGSPRPPLPPRTSQTAIPHVKADATPAVDPEADADDMMAGEKEQQMTLLRALLTQTVAVHLDALETLRDDSPIALTERLLDRRHPEHNIPGRMTAVEAFMSIQALQDREGLLKQIVYGAESDLHIKASDMLDTLLETERKSKDPEDEDATSDTTVTLSRVGILDLLAVQTYSALVRDRDLPFSLSLTQHDTLLKGFLQTSAEIVDSAPAVDSLLLLGWTVILSSNSAAWGGDDESFNGYLQRLSFISASAPFARLRQQAHLLTSVVFHARAAVSSRVQYIRDTLDNCPYESLQLVALTWLKDEVAAVLDAQHASFPIRLGSHYGATLFLEASTQSKTLALGIRDLCPVIFKLPTTQDPANLEQHVPYFTALMNLVYVLLSPGAQSSSGFDDLASDLALKPDSLEGYSQIMQAIRTVVNDGDGASLATGPLEDALGRVDARLGEITAKS